MNYLFWNTGRNDNINNILESIILQYSCDIIGLAEYSSDIDELLNNLSSKGHKLYHVKKIGCHRIDILTKFKPNMITHSYEDNYYTIKKIPHETLGNHIIAFVHFPSKLHLNDDGHIIQSQLLKDDIEKAEAKFSLNNTIILGDFNMNPFEKGMISAAAISSVSSCNIACKLPVRTIKNRKYSTFYNPMWNLLGDLNKPIGTYFYDNSDYINYYWNVFDQVLLWPSLSEVFEVNSIKIIDKVGETSLINASNYRPIKKISDHLPLFFKLG